MHWGQYYKVFPKSHLKWNSQLMLLATLVSTMFLGFWNDAIGVLAKSKVLPKSKKYWIRQKKIQKIEKNTK